MTAIERLILNNQLIMLREMQSQRFSAGHRCSDELHRMCRVTEVVLGIGERPMSNGHRRECTPDRCHCGSQ